MGRSSGRARALARFDAWQRRHRRAAQVVAVVKKFGEDRASGLATLIAYNAFFSLFPLLLVFVSVLGYVLEDDPRLQEEVTGSALERIPVIGAQLGDSVEPLTGSAGVLVVGLAGALWTGLGVTVALGRAFDEIWNTPRLQQGGPLARRARGALVLAILALTLVASGMVGGVAIAADVEPVTERLVAIAASLLVTAAAVMAGFRLLSARPRPLSDLLPGVLFAVTGWWLLQLAGGWYVTRVVEGAGEIYGTFALVIGLLSWFWLGAHVLLLGAELNVVRSRQLWPRALTGAPGPADRRAMRRHAGALRQDPRQLVTITFRDEPGSAACRPPLPSSGTHPCRRGASDGGVEP